MTSVPDILLNDGNTIPQIGFGVFQILPDDTSRAVVEAIEAGYRHIDTAQMYGNDRGVGDGIRASGIPREEVFVTSKLNTPNHEPDVARRTFDETLDQLGFEYVDLFLIHWPLPMLYGGDFVTTWRVLEEFKRDGRARSIGVSNFQVHHLEKLIAESNTVPAVNQIEVHPYFGNEAVRRANRRHDIVTEAWAPIAKGRVTTDETILSIAERHGQTAAQVALRRHLHGGDLVFLNSASRPFLKENIDLLPFEFSPDEMRQVGAHHQGDACRIAPHPEVFARIG